MWSWIPDEAGTWTLVNSVGTVRFTSQRGMNATEPFQGLGGADLSVDTRREYSELPEWITATTATNPLAANFWSLDACEC